jgi:hypothetical protein
VRDRSGSVGPEAEQLHRAVTAAVVDEVKPPRAPVAVWRFGGGAIREPSTVFEGTPADAEDLAEMERDLSATVGAVPGTFVVPVLEKLERVGRAAEARGERLVIVLVTDAGFDDMDQARAVAERLAALPNIVAVALLPAARRDGANSRTRAEEAFAAFGRRLVVADPSDVQQGLDRLRAIVRAADRR